ncbi:transmembrane protein, putative (macronuclear) [Tetrahymena thermophila SB210]|uniref:Transmembrane protein, putative n=1 Tax=Tetrahymena thermophila (strain SB210) TaxID=312017 RepID=I7MHQ5_TETTS|nr:transmembrane protein, putative [Tetrahymena thermophila SB210]EAS03193.2 transmembrane protein, putative [Tetrahymena thermophila SB210]|eukprot:XP_001023438.2 transmembrane protein, putative [Tetrahymena thermophila SB210]
MGRSKARGCMTQTILWLRISAHISHTNFQLSFQLQVSFRSGKNYQREADQFKNEKNEEIILPVRKPRQMLWTQLMQTETSLEGAQLTWSQLWYFLSVVGQLSISGSSQIFEGTSSSLSKSVSYLDFFQLAGQSEFVCMFLVHSSYGSNTISLYEMSLILCHVLLLLFSSFIFKQDGVTNSKEVRKFKNKKFISKMFILQGMVLDYQEMILLSSKIRRICRMEIFSPNIPVQIFESSFRR